MKTEDFDYDLPEHFIANAPAEPRDSCKLMVVNRDGSIQHRIFRDIGEYLNAGDLLVVNETRVFPARLFGRKDPTGAHVETLLLDKVASAPDTERDQTWNCLVKPGKRLKVGAKVVYEHDGKPVLEGEVINIDESNGSRAIEFSCPSPLNFDEAVHLIGHTPLPPYIKGYTGDDELYQTVYSKEERSAAAPTAGLHFTEALLDELQNAGIDIAHVHLEVGLDTFRLVAEENAEDHEMHTELYTVPPETVEAINETKAHGGRVVCVGTTTVRSLESAAASGTLEAKDRAATALYILPGYEFQVADAIITNFHVPKSTLMMLVSAFSGRENIMRAYEAAKESDYRFFSFGDAMLLL